MNSKSQLIFPAYKAILERVGENIRQARIRRRLTARDVARRASIDPATLYEIEKGNPRVSLGGYFNTLLVLELQDDFLKLAADENSAAGLRSLHQKAGRMGVKKNTWVYADWKGMKQPRCIGRLSTGSDTADSYSFVYDVDWVGSKEQLLLDPHLRWHGLHDAAKEKFLLFFDCLPGEWGRGLQQKNNGGHTLNEMDLFLETDDENRAGALRFKADPDGPFMNNRTEYPAPIWPGITGLQQAAAMAEPGRAKKMKQALKMLLSPGASLGGNRPKANILDLDGHLWIAKFPSRKDIFDHAAWEFVAYRLAVQAGVVMAHAKIEKLGTFTPYFLQKGSTAMAGTGSISLRRRH